MTVHELIELLAKMPADAKVFTLTRDDFEQFQDDIDTAVFDPKSGLVFVTQSDVFEDMVVSEARTK